MWRGLKPSLTEKLWSLKPASCDEFLREVRRYQEMTSRARQEDWAMGMLGKQMPPVKEDRLERLEKMMEGLMGAIAQGLRNRDGTQETYNNALGGITENRNGHRMDNPSASDATR
jgi:hypothetical protein